VARVWKDEGISGGKGRILGTHLAEQIGHSPV
jgi:hypothetical protein